MIKLFTLLVFLCALYIEYINVFKYESIDPSIKYLAYKYTPVTMSCKRYKNVSYIYSYIKTKKFKNKLKHSLTSGIPTSTGFYKPKHIVWSKYIQENEFNNVFNSLKGELHGILHTSLQTIYINRKSIVPAYYNRSQVILHFPKVEYIWCAENNNINRLFTHYIHIDFCV